MSSIYPENLIKLLKETQRLAIGNAKSRKQLIGDIDPLDPDLSDSDKRIVLNACKKSPPFFLWLLKQCLNTPSVASTGALWGDVSQIAMTNKPFQSLLRQSIIRAYPTLKGKRLTISAWYFNSGDLCAIATTNDHPGSFKLCVHTSAVVIERNGGKLVPASIPAKHLAGLFDREWKSK